MRYCFPFLVSAFLSVYCMAQGDKRKSAIQPLLDMKVLYSPKSIKIDGKTNLFYELHASNFSHESLVIKKIELLDSITEKIIAVFEGEAIVNRLYKVCSETGEVNPGEIKAGCGGVIYIEIAVENLTGASILHHVITFQSKKQNSGVSHKIKRASVKADGYSTLVVGAPLKGGPWVAIYEPKWERGHRRVIYTVDGKARIPGRFAIDFILLDNEGKVSSGEQDSVINWYGYSADVLAVADAVVSSTRDDFSESVTLSDHAVHNADKATGNYISLQVGKNQFVFYEHLKPGSISVKPGQKVKKGEVIAKLGFTGQTTGPHLHIHVADADSPLGAEGLPFALERFTLLGSYSDFGNFEKIRWQDITPHRKITNERPAANVVINFE